MQLARVLWDHEMKNSGTIESPEGNGLVGWILDVVRGWRGRGELRQKQMHLVETLALGGKRQLMLVRCAGESFLVGGGLESVETIVRLKKGVTADEVENKLDESCR